MPTQTTQAIVTAAQTLSDQVDKLSFEAPVTHVYNPLRYAWQSHERYLTRFATGPRRVLMLGMNPGPWGMAQTGVPFGEVSAVRDWMKIDAPIGKPLNEHPKRVIEGFACNRSEVSGRRLWGLFGERFGTPQAFFREHFIVNYCPLVFMEDSARNRTPDKLPSHERETLEAVCDEHLASAIRILRPKWLIGVGGFAEACLKRVAPDHPQIGRVLHPSPASPAANRGWAEQATQQLVEQGVWPSDA